MERIKSHLLSPSAWVAKMASCQCLTYADTWLFATSPELCVNLSDETVLGG